MTEADDQPLSISALASGPDVPKQIADVSATSTPYAGRFALSVGIAFTRPVMSVVKPTQ